MMLYLCATFCLLGLAAGGSVIQSNQYLDSVFINYLPSEVQRSREDPIKLPGFTQQSKDKILLVNVNVNTEYKNGNLTGLSRPLRERNCSATSFQRGLYQINCTMSFNSLHLHYQGALRYGQVPTINFKVQAPINKVLADIKISSSSNGRYPQVSDFRLTSGVFFNAKYEGLGVASSIEKNLRANFTYAATNNILNVLNGQFKTTLQRSIANTIIPL